ncbi:hypothetical protein BJY00DRAFT_122201 [Aspergillus carlsbadensis]|nr:hypothetical protein BJY00DRAFT_122201 [Aspergillus carlsbadensis]
MFKSLLNGPSYPAEVRVRRPSPPHYSDIADFNSPSNTSHFDITPASDDVYVSFDPRQPVIPVIRDPRSQSSSREQSPEPPRTAQRARGRNPAQSAFIEEVDEFSIQDVPTSLRYPRPSTAKRRSPPSSDDTDEDIHVYPPGLTRYPGSPYSTRRPRERHSGDAFYQNDPPPVRPVRNIPDSGYSVPSESESYAPGYHTDRRLSPNPAYRKPDDTEYGTDHDYDYPSAYDHHLSPSTSGQQSPLVSSPSASTRTNLSNPT